MNVRRIGFLDTARARSRGFEKRRQEILEGGSGGHAARSTVAGESRYIWEALLAKLVKIDVGYFHNDGMALLPLTRLNQARGVAAIQIGAGCDAMLLSLQAATDGPVAGDVRNRHAD